MPVRRAVGPPAYGRALWTAVEAAIATRPAERARARAGDAVAVAGAIGGRFAFEIIRHQITDTIGKEEETEAWNEMSDFFGEEFGKIIIEIQEKYNDDKDLKDYEDPQKLRQELLAMNVTKEEEKKDMWND